MVESKKTNATKQKKIEMDTADKAAAEEGIREGADGAEEVRGPAPHQLRLRPQELRSATGGTEPRDGLLGPGEGDPLWRIDRVGNRFVHRMLDTSLACIVGLAPSCTTSCTASCVASCAPRAGLDPHPFSTHADLTHCDV